MANIGERIIRFKIDYGDSFRSTEQARSGIGGFTNAIKDAIKTIGTFTTILAAGGAAYLGIKRLLATESWDVFVRAVKNARTNYKAFTDDLISGKDAAKNITDVMTSAFKKIGTNITDSATKAFDVIKKAPESIKEKLKTLGEAFSPVYKNITQLEFGILTAMGPIGDMTIKLSEAAAASGILAVALSPVSSVLAGIAAKAALVSIGIVAAINAMVYAAGALVQSIGNKLKQVSEQWAQIGLEFEKQQFGLEVAVRGFHKMTNDFSISAEDLASQIRRISAETGVAAAEIKQGVNVMFEMSRVTKLTGDQIESLIKLMADFSIVRGVPFFQVVYAIDQSFRGWHQSASALGLTLDDASVAVLSAQKGWGEAATVAGQAATVTNRYRAALEQLEFAHNAGAESANNFTFGALRRLQGELNTIHGLLGQGVTKFWQPYYATIAQGAALIRSALGESMLQTIGYVTAATGGFLSLMGILVKLAAVIIPVSAAIRLLGSVMASLKVIDLLRGFMSLKTFLENNFIGVLNLLGVNLGATHVKLLALTAGATSFGDAIRILATTSLVALGKAFVGLLTLIAPWALLLGGATFAIYQLIKSYNQLSGELRAVEKDHDPVKTAISELNRSAHDSASIVDEANTAWGRFAETMRMLARDASGVTIVESMSALIEKMRLITVTARLRATLNEQILRDNDRIRRQLELTGQDAPKPTLRENFVKVPLPGHRAAVNLFLPQQAIGQKSDEQEIQESLIRETEAKSRIVTAFANFGPSHEIYKRIKHEETKIIEEEQKKRNAIERRRAEELVRTDEMAGAARVKLFKALEREDETQINAKKEFLEMSGRYQEALTLENELLTSRAAQLANAAGAANELNEKTKAYIKASIDARQAAKSADLELQHARALSEAGVYGITPDEAEDLMFKRLQERRRFELHALLKENLDNQQKTNAILALEEKKDRARRLSERAAELEEANKKEEAFQLRAMQRRLDLEARGVAPELRKEILTRMYKEHYEDVETLVRKSVADRINTELEFTAETKRMQGATVEAVRILRQRQLLDLEEMLRQERLRIEREGIEKERKLSELEKRAATQRLTVLRQSLEQEKQAIRERFEFAKRVEEEALQAQTSRRISALEFFGRNTEAIRYAGEVAEQIADINLKARKLQIDQEYRDEEEKRRALRTAEIAHSAEIAKIRLDTFKKIQDAELARFGTIKSAYKEEIDARIEQRQAEFALDKSNLEATLSGIEERRAMLRLEHDERLRQIDIMRITAEDREKLISSAMRKESAMRMALIAREAQARKQAISEAASGINYLLGLVSPDKRKKFESESVTLATDELNKFVKSVREASATATGLERDKIRELAKTGFDQLRKRFKGDASRIFENVNVDSLVNPVEAQPAAQDTLERLKDEMLDTYNRVGAAQEGMRQIATDALNSIQTDWQRLNNILDGTVSKLTAISNQLTNIANSSNISASEAENTVRTFTSSQIIRPPAMPPIKRNEGGWIPGTGNKDTVPALLTPGEFVVRKDVAQQNKEFFEQLNNGMIENFNRGGAVRQSNYSILFNQLKSTLNAYIPQTIKVAAENFFNQLKTNFSVMLTDLKLNLEYLRGIKPSQSIHDSGRIPLQQLESKTPPTAEQILSALVKQFPQYAPRTGSTVASGTSTHPGMYSWIDNKGVLRISDKGDHPASAISSNTVGPRPQLFIRGISDPKDRGQKQQSLTSSFDKEENIRSLQHQTRMIQLNNAVENERRKLDSINNSMKMREIQHKHNLDFIRSSARVTNPSGYADLDYYKSPEYKKFWEADQKLTGAERYNKIMKPQSATSFNPGMYWTPQGYRSDDPTANKELERFYQERKQHIMPSRTLDSQSYAPNIEMPRSSNFGMDVKTGMLEAIQVVENSFKQLHDIFGEKARQLIQDFNDEFAQPIGHGLTRGLADALDFDKRRTMGLG